MKRRAFRAGRGGFLSLLLLLGLAGMSPAQTNWYVAATGGSDLNSGLSWAQAFQSISTGVAYAVAGDSVVVSDGVYNVTATILITNGITVRSTNGPAVTTVQRTGAGYLRVVEIVSSAGGAVIEGLTIRNGYTYTDYDGGAGVKMAAGTLTNCIVRENFARSAGNSTRGAGVYLQGGTVANCVMAFNDCGVYWGGNGGGVYLATGIVQNCVISSNTTYGYFAGIGGGVYVATPSGQVVNCTITTNNAMQGGGVYMVGGLLRNCSVARNLAGAGVYMTAGNVENCTVVGNRGGYMPANGLYMSGGGVTNTIVYGNEAGFCSTVADADYVAVTKTGGAFDFSTAENAVAGVSNSTADPRFLDLEAGNYRLGVGSPCSNTATTLDWMAAGTDLDSGARIVGGAPDQGAYEATPGAGPYRVYWSGTPTLGTESASVVLAAYVEGAATNGTTYYWDFGNGTTTSGTDKQTVTNTYGIGLYTVSLSVTNDSAQGATVTRTRYVRIMTTSTVYVASSGSGTLPYTNWLMAATNLQDAIDEAAGMVMVTDGTYNVTAQVNIRKGVTVQSVNGPGVTTVQRSANPIRVFYLSPQASNAVLSGFTIRNGRTEVNQGGGGGLRVDAGMVTNCVIRENVAVRDYTGPGNAQRGGGVNMSGGLVVGCIITTNSTPDYWSGKGGGVYMTGGTLRNCTITNNTSVSANENDNGKKGGGVYVSGGGLVSHCLIMDNNARYGGGIYMEAGGTLRNNLIRKSQAGGGVEMTAGTVENCTITDNKGGDRVYSGLSMTAGAVTNTIVYWNESGYASVTKTGGSFDFSVSENSVAGTSNSTTDPDFVNRSAGNYRLASASPCVNSGTNLGWTGGSMDLDGNSRVSDLIVDRGAYESNSTNGPLSVGFIGNPVSGVETTNVVFTATVAGSNTAGVTYYWMFGDGNSTNGSTKQVVTNRYGPGLFTVSVSVTNGIGEGAACTKLGYIRITTATTIYCATNGGSSPPYTNWASASTNIGEAISQGTTLVLVSNGTYYIGSAIALDKAITVRSVNGPSQTRIERAGGNIRIATVSHSNAVLDGFVLTGGNIGPGAGVNLSAGLVQNCIISNNVAASASGGGAYISGGVLQNCVIVTNFSNAGFIEGGGVFLTTGDGKLRNCLVMGNYGQNRGGGVYLDGSSAEVDNCTIVGNNNPYRAGGIYKALAGSQVRNCIVVTHGGDIWNDAGAMIAGVTYSCSPGLTSGAGNITNDPMFKVNGSGNGWGFAPGNYHLKSGSPCINAGTNLYWMAGATDLEGRARLAGQPDMGVYECPRSGTVFVVH